jgi:hypothetical protein
MTDKDIYSRLTSDETTLHDVLGVALVRRKESGGFYYFTRDWKPATAKKFSSFRPDGLAAAQVMMRRPEMKKSTNNH